MRLLYVIGLQVGGSGGQFGVEENRVKVLGADLEGINLVDWPFEGVGSTAGQWGSVDVNQGDMIVGISSDGHPMKVCTCVCAQKIVNIFVCVCVCMNVCMNL